MASHKFHVLLSHVLLPPPQYLHLPSSLRAREVSAPLGVHHPLILCLLLLLTLL